MKKIIIPNELVNIIAEQMIIDEHIKKAKKLLEKKEYQSLKHKALTKT